MGHSDHKDLFSTQSKQYAAFRPTYRDDLYHFILQHVKVRDSAWDCATGSGQVANYLALEFTHVFATDISQEQLNNAAKRPNITCLVTPAEKAPFPSSAFDLITVGQALHCFNREPFYHEVRRVARRDAVLAVWGYGGLSVDADIDSILDTFYTETVGPYWDQARKLVEEAYRSVQFPFQEIPAPPFTLSVSWSLEHLTGYLSSWSATQQYIRVNHHNPVLDVREKLEKSWRRSEQRSINFPLFLRLFHVFRG